MLALVLFLTLCGELCVYTFAGFYIWQQFGWQWIELVTLALATGVVLRLLIVALSFLIAAVYRRARPVDASLGLGGASRLYLAEAVAFLVLYTLLQPLAPLLSRAEDEGENCGTAVPILLVHGLLCNAGFWWALRRFLRRRGQTCLFTLNLEPLFGDIEHYADQLGARIQAVRARTGSREVILVGHSMGGLVARAYLRKSGAPAGVLKVITLGSPHHGSEHARWFWGENLRQMRPGSKWLRTLNESEALSTAVPFTSIYSLHDNLVAPQTSSVLPYAHNRVVAGVGHLSMAFSKKFQKLVYEEIRVTLPIS